MNVLLNLIQSDTGRTFKAEASNRFVGPCPFCHSQSDPKSDRLVVWTDQNRYWCRQCRSSGNVIEYLKQQHNMTVKQAYDYLRDQGELPTLPKFEEKVLPPTYTDFSLSKYTLADVKLWAITGKDKAQDYYKTWLTEDVIDQNLIGYAKTATWTGYTIPHFWHSNNQIYLKGIKIRRDELRSPDWQPKYFGVKGSRFAGCYPDTLVSNPDGSRLADPIDFLFIVEAEKDALFLNSIGYYTVAYSLERNWNKHLNTVMQNVIMPIIIADNDGGKGMERALHIQENFRIKPPIIVPQLAKQPTDIQEKYGTIAVHEWIKSTKLGVEPV